MVCPFANLLLETVYRNNHASDLVAILDYYDNQA